MYISCEGDVMSLCVVLTEGIDNRKRYRLNSTVRKYEGKLVVKEEELISNTLEP